MKLSPVLAVSISSILIGCGVFPSPTKYIPSALSNEPLAAEARDGDGGVTFKKTTANIAGTGVFNFSKSIPWSINFTEMREILQNRKSKAEISKNFLERLHFKHDLEGGGKQDISAIVAAECRKRIYKNNNIASCFEMLRQDLAFTPSEIARTKNENFVSLSLSGGGPRSSLFSEAFIDELTELGLASEIDVVSAISGGARTAALYAASCDLADPDPSNPDQAGRGTEHSWDSPRFMRADCKTSANGVARAVWSPGKNRERLSRDLVEDFIWNFTHPEMMFKYLFTSFDRTDMMKEAFCDQIYSTDKPFIGSLLANCLTVSDVNPLRPNFLLNTVVMSRDDAADPWRELVGRCTSLTIENFFPFQGRKPSLRLTAFDADATVASSDDAFVTGDFPPGELAALNSDLGLMPLGNAVVATNAFPVLFRAVTQGRYGRAAEDAEDHSAYLHMFDSGGRDHVGVAPIMGFLDWHFLGRVQHLPGSAPYAANPCNVSLQGYRAASLPKVDRGQPKVVAFIVDAGIAAAGIDHKQRDSKTEDGPTFDLTPDLNYAVGYKDAISMVDILIDEARLNRFQEFGETMAAMRDEYGSDCCKIVSFGVRDVFKRVEKMFEDARTEWVKFRDCEDDCEAQLKKEKLSTLRLGRIADDVHVYAADKTHIGARDMSGLLRVLGELGTDGGDDGLRICTDAYSAEIRKDEAVDGEIPQRGENDPRIEDVRSSVEAKAAKVLKRQDERLKAANGRIVARFREHDLHATDASVVAMTAATEATPIDDARLFVEACQYVMMRDAAIGLTAESEEEDSPFIRAARLLARRLIDQWIVDQCAVTDAVGSDTQYSIYGMEIDAERVKQALGSGRNCRTTNRTNAIASLSRN